MNLLRQGLLVLVLYLLDHTAVFAAAFQCPAATEQKVYAFEGDITGQAQTLLKVVQTEVQGTVQKTVVEFIF